jgi:hypothetical protein
MIMATDKVTQRYSQDKVRGWFKTSLLVFGLVAATVVAITVVEDDVPQRTAIAVPAAHPPEATLRRVIEAPDRQS